MTADYDPTELCYLCGKQLGAEQVNEDHLFQQQFLSRPQPKTKGFDYAGTLPTHTICHSKFGNAGEGPESICRKALQLLEVLHSKRALWRERKDNPNVRIVGINSASLPEFTKQDVEFFKLIDATEVPYSDLASGKFLVDKKRVNPFAIPINIALSTLAKSTSAFLVKRFSYPRQGRWRILAIPHYAGEGDFTFDDLFGDTRPLEVGVKLWIRREHNGWLAAYKHNRLLVFFCFESSASDYFQNVTKVFRNASCPFYDCDNLISLVDYDWSSNQYPL
jgi:hypothetical protein